jgi:hypothetical protein
MRADNGKSNKKQPGGKIKRPGWFGRCAGADVVLCAK